MSRTQTLEAKDSRFFTTLLTLLNPLVPATIAIIGGTPHVGLTKQEIEMLGKEGHKVCKLVFAFVSSTFLTLKPSPPSPCPLAGEESFSQGLGFCDCEQAARCDDCLYYDASCSRRWNKGVRHWGYWWCPPWGRVHVGYLNGPERAREDTGLCDMRWREKYP